MNIKSSGHQRIPQRAQFSFPQPKKRNVLDKVQDTVRIGYVNTMVSLPGAVGGGVFGATVGVMNSLPLAPFFGLKPVLVAGAVLGTAGALVGGAIWRSLATLD